MNKLFDQEYDIVQAYSNGKRDNKIIKELSIKYDCSESTLYKILKKHGIVCKGRKLTLEEEKAILKEYSETHSIVDTSHNLGHGRQSVYLVLKKYNLETKQKYFSKEEESKIVKYYIEGVSFCGIIKIIGKGNQYNIREVLVKNDVEIRSSTKKAKEISEKQISNILKMYEQKLSTHKIAKTLNLTNYLVSRILKQNGIDERLGNSYYRYYRCNGRIFRNGYVGIRISIDDPFQCMANQMGYVLEHRYVMAKSIGRPLKQTETVHHKNGNKQDNRLENLQLRNGQHGKGQAYKCNCCGSIDVSPIDLIRVDFS